MTATTSPWVYIFSRFTSEALLFEALIIFTLSALYTGFWLLRKRKFGVIEKQVPAGVVKYYLNELIVDAELLRSQLFGMLTGQGIPATKLAHLGFGGSQSVGTFTSVEGGSAPHDPASAQTLATLEAKLTEQAKQIENFTSEKVRVEKELIEAKAAKATGPAASGIDPNAKLQEKIALLEGKLAEYSVIEDDLANLKRLQQENAALKTQLGGKAPVASPTPQAAAPVESSKTTLPTAQADEAGINGSIGGTSPAEAGIAAKTETSKDAASASAATDASTHAAVAGATNSNQPSGATAGKDDAGTAGKIGDEQTAAQSLAKPVSGTDAGVPGGDFEGLVDQVEKSLQPAAVASETTAASAAVTSSTMDNPAATIEKSDADLVSEFEKCSTARALAILSTTLWVSYSHASIAHSTVEKQLLSDIRRNSILANSSHSASGSFDSLLANWEEHYGTKIVATLLELARDPAAADTERYVAVMGIAKIGGRESAPLLKPFLKDPSWMVRNGTLRALSALRNPGTATAVLPLIKDPALVVRLEAIQSIEKLKPEGSAKALIAAIEDPINYHHGKAQWVPQKALEALTHLRAQKTFTEFENKEASLNLSAFLENVKDPSLKPQIEATLRAMNAD